MEGYLQISDQLLDLCRGQCQRSGDVCIASRRSNLLHCRGGDICRVISVSVGWAHDSSPFVRMCRNLPKVSEWNILVHNFAGASVGTLILIVVGGGALVVAATISRGPSSTRSRATISVRYFLAPLCRSSQLEVWSLPSTYTLEPLATSSPTISARRCKATMLCLSVRSCHASFRSLNLSLVARLKLATGVPLCEYLTSGSLPTFPTRMTLFTLFGISLPPIHGHMQNERSSAFAGDCPASDCADRPLSGRDFASPATSSVNHPRGSLRVSGIVEGNS